MTLPRPKRTKHKNSAEARIDTGFGAVFQQFRNPFYFDCFGEGLRLAKDKMNEKNVYYMNPSFDK